MIKSDKHFESIEDSIDIKNTLVWRLAVKQSERWGQLDNLQTGFGIGSRIGVTTPKHFYYLFGDLTKVRYSRRRGYRGKLKDGRKIRLW